MTNNTTQPRTGDVGHALRAAGLLPRECIYRPSASPSVEARAVILTGPTKRGRYRVRCYGAIGSRWVFWAESHEIEEL